MKTIGLSAKAELAIAGSFQFTTSTPDEIKSFVKAAIEKGQFAPEKVAGNLAASEIYEWCGLKPPRMVSVSEQKHQAVVERRDAREMAAYKRWAESGMTYRALGKEMGKSAERVRQREGRF